MTEAAAVPETLFTVWHNMVERGHLKSGETFLVHGGTSGIGTTAIQLAKALGARVITTAGTAEKCEACRKLGADVAVNYKTEDFVAAMQSGDRRQRRRRYTRHGRRRLHRAQLRSGGGRGTHRADRVPGQRQGGSQFHAASCSSGCITPARRLRSRSVADKGAIRAAVEAGALPLIVAGKVRPVIYKTFPLAEAAAAHALMEIERAHRQDHSNPLKIHSNHCPPGAEPIVCAGASGREIGALSTQKASGGFRLQQSPAEPK